MRTNILEQGRILVIVGEPDAFILVRLKCPGACTATSRTVPCACRCPSLSRFVFDVIVDNTVSIDVTRIQDSQRQVHQLQRHAQADQIEHTEGSHNVMKLER